jgi:hypothetical protein
MIDYENCGAPALNATNMEAEIQDTKEPGK